MALSEDFIYQLRLGNPIEDVVNSYSTIKRHGSTSKCLCPFHSEKTPSCTIYSDTQSFYCFGCGAGGDVISFIKKIENLSYYEAVRFLAERAGIAMPDTSGDDFARKKSRTYEINRETANFYFKCLLSGSDKRGLAYFKERKLLPQTIKKYGLGYAPDQWDALRNHLRSLGFTDSEMVTADVCRFSEKGSCYDNFRGRVIFPIIDLRGNVIAFGGRTIDSRGPKYLNSADTPVFKKSRNLFSLNFAKNSSSKKLILAEGYMDVIAINQAGFENVVATLGTALTPEQARLMSQYASEVIISYDSDAAGQAATQRAINLLSSAGLTTKIIKLHDAKDPDEYIKKFGSTRFKFLLDESNDAIDFELSKCKTGLNISEDSDKYTYLRKVVGVISSLDDSLLRDVYISKISRECEINTSVLYSKVEEAIKNKHKIKQKLEWESTKRSLTQRDEINPEASKYSAQSKAEEFIILYLIKNQDKLKEIKNKISADEFVTQFNKKVFLAVTETIENYSDFSLSLLSDKFNDAEMGKISGIEAKNRDLTINDDTLSDCIELLKNFNQSLVYNKETDLSDDDLLNLQMQMQIKKRK
ncbi:MAG: DNA primase [Oscillospiraceae bacterium]|nr:DNA primase [Oscillospiraceae bacterium]MDD6081459.1 DNA primase [Oscillospiraceae bacterium]